MQTTARLGRRFGLAAAALCLAACGSSGAGGHDAAAGSSGGDHDGGTGGAGGTAVGHGGVGGASAGGSGGTGTCGNVEPCGGSLLGTWTITGECINSVTLQPVAQSLCAVATVQSIAVTPTGTFTFGSDSSYSASETVNAAIVFAVPASCVTGQTCAAFAAPFAAQLVAGETFTCAGSGDCLCTETVATTTTDSGTYAVTGANGVTLNSTSGGTSMSGNFCVQGSALHLITLDTTMDTGPMGQATIDKDVTAQKAP